MYPAFKRMFDFLFCFILLIILSPVFLIISIMIKTDTKGPVYFKQRRIGRLNRHFDIIKFRTMRADAPGDVPSANLKNPGEYITKTGKFLRRTSLDELPQIINVIKGDMSLIGPRPALYNQYDLIAARDRANLHRLYPGITGLAQVNGRDELPIPKKVKFDTEYAERMSLALDAKIFFVSLKKVLKSEGYREGAE